MEEVKSLAKWWNSEVVGPSLSTSLCIVSGPAPGRQHRPQAHVHFQRQNGSHLGPGEDKNVYDYPR